MCIHAGSPSVSSLTYDDQSRNFTCTSTGGPATTDFVLPKLADIGHDFESLIVGVVNKDHTIVGVVTQFVGVVNKVHTIVGVVTQFAL